MPEHFDLGVGLQPDLHSSLLIRPVASYGDTECLWGTPSSGERLAKFLCRLASVLGDFLLVSRNVKGNCQGVVAALPNNSRVGMVHDECHARSLGELGRILRHKGD